MNKTPKIVTALVAMLVIGLVAFAWACASAPAVQQLALEPAEDVLSEWNAGMADGKLSSVEVERMTAALRYMADQNDRLREVLQKSYPPVQDPSRWAEYLTGIVLAGGAAYGTYKKVKSDIHKERDAQRSELGEDVVPDKVAALRSVRRKPPFKPAGPTITGPHTGA